MYFYTFPTLSFTILFKLILKKLDLVLFLHQDILLNLHQFCLDLFLRNKWYIYCQKLKLKLYYRVISRFIEEYLGEILIVKPISHHAQMHYHQQQIYTKQKEEVIVCNQYFHLNKECISLIYLFFNVRHIFYVHKYPRYVEIIFYQQHLI